MLKMGENSLIWKSVSNLVSDIENLTERIKVIIVLNLYMHYLFL